MTSTQRFAEILLGEPPADYIDRHRSDNQSYQWIAARMAFDTGGHVQVSRETVRKWHTEQVAVDSDPTPAHGIERPTR